MSYEETIIVKLCSLSVNKTDYNQAKKEWLFTGEIIENQHPTEHCELCEHQIKYQYIIKNSLNGTMLKVGSECVNNYLDIHYDIKKELKALKLKNHNEAIIELRNILYPIHTQIAKIEESQLNHPYYDSPSANAIKEKAWKARNLIINITYGGKFGRSCLKKLPEILADYHIETVDIEKVEKLVNKTLMK